jgi:hypothetical protein
MKGKTPRDEWGFEAMDYWTLTKYYGLVIWKDIRLSLL